MKIIQRNDYMDFLIRHREKPIIKVVSGVRRCGKSTLFHLFRDYLLAQGVSPDAIIAINFEDLAYESLPDYHALYAYIMERMQPQTTNYIFLDEVRHVPQFEKAVDSLFIKENADVYLTGSNAYFLSGDLATLLSGRYVELRMLPLSFKEYCIGTEDREKLTLRERYEQYILESAFPYTLQLHGQAKDIRDYLSGLYHTILLKDVVERLKKEEASYMAFAMKVMDERKEGHRDKTEQTHFISASLTKLLL